MIGRLRDVVWHFRAAATAANENERIKLRQEALKTTDDTVCIHPSSTNFIFRPHERQRIKFSFLYSIIVLFTVRNE
jgi:hypothetical protein